MGNLTPASAAAKPPPPALGQLLGRTGGGALARLGAGSHDAPQGPSKKKASPLPAPGQSQPHVRRLVHRTDPAPASHWLFEPSSFSPSSRCQTRLRLHVTRRAGPSAPSPASLLAL